MRDGDFCLPGRAGDVELEVDMKAQSLSSQPVKTCWRIILEVNLLLGSFCALECSLDTLGTMNGPT